MPSQRPLLLVACLLAGALLPAQADRGVWFWASTTLPSGAASPHGSDDIVGVSDALENQAITFLTHCGVTRLYGSYKNRPVTFPEQIRPWNAKLAAAGIQSQLLISGFEPTLSSHLTDPDHTNLVNKVLGRLVDFNNAALPEEQFKALHLDLEPQTLDVWSDVSTTAADRRVMLDHLLDAYIDIRAALDTNGYSWVPIYADIPPTWDKMPLPDPADGKVGWTSTTDRANWFAAIDAVLDGISIMTFNKDNFADIDTITDYERNPLVFSGESRVGIQPKVGAGELWPTYTDFLTVLNDLDANYGKADLENYAFWKAFKPLITVSPLPVVYELATASPGIVVVGKPGHIYIVRQSTGLGRDWKEIARQHVQSRAPQRIRFPVKRQGRQTFWKVEEWPAQKPPER